jgi:hypothetical protein
MIRKDALAFALAGWALICGPARAQEPENEESRFSFYRAQEGFLRLDGRTGQVSLCTKRPAGWICQAVPEERAAFEAEIARVQAENAVLKREVLAHDLPLPAGIRSDAAPAAGPAADGHEAGQIMGVIGNVWRRVVAMVVNVQRDLLGRS